MPECQNDNDPCDVLPRAGEAWSVCLPFGGRIWADGNGVHAQGGIAPPDGVYGKVVISNGCLVGVEPEDVPLYTGSPCAPLPNGCGGASVMSAAIGPMQLDLDTPTVICEIKAGAGVTVTGNGTEEDPYIISADTGIYIRSDNSAIDVTGEGTRKNPFTLKHKKGLATSLNGMTFDAFGHLVSASENETAGTKGVKGIVPGFGVKVVPDNKTGIIDISLQSQPDKVAGNYQLGSHNITLDQAGRVSSISRVIDIAGAPFTLPCGSSDLQINQFGSITAITDTMKLGSGYLIILDAAQTTAQFTMRCSSALAGICFSESDLKNIVVVLDNQKCDRIDKLFWGGGVFMEGSHTLNVTGNNGAMAVLLIAIGMMDRAW